MEKRKRHKNMNKKTRHRASFLPIIGLIWASNRQMYSGLYFFWYSISSAILTLIIFYPVVKYFN